MLLIAKFGGTSLATNKDLIRAAERIKELQQGGAAVVAVVSAMGDRTDRLLAKAHRAVASASPRELDVIAATGELVSSAMLASVLTDMQIPARSLSGAQAGIRTNSQHQAARIKGISTAKIEALLAANIVPVVAGFQGVNDDGDTATLGRGGSDTTAAALGAALNANKCLIYTDVAGVCTADPRICPEGYPLASICYEEMLELAALGTKVLHPRAVEHAAQHNLILHVLSSFDSSQAGTIIQNRMEASMEQQPITSITYSIDDAKISVIGVPDRPGIAAQVFSAISAQNIDVDVIVQSVSSENHTTDMSFTVNQAELDLAIAACESLAAGIGARGVTHDSAVAKVSMVGAGMRGQPGVAALMFATLAEEKINIKMISTSEIKLSVIIDQDRCADAVRALHSAFELAPKPTDTLAPAAAADK